MKNKENPKSRREFWIKIFRDIFKHYITVHIKKIPGASKINYNFKKNHFKKEQMMIKNCGLLKLGSV